MKIETRLILTYVVRLALLFFAAWVALYPGAMHADTHQLTRIALAAGFLVLSIVVGEQAKLQTQFDMLGLAIRAARAKVSGEGTPSDDEAAVGILIRALGSREESTREKAHRNLVRLTGQDLPPEKDAWERWWRERRQTSAEAGGNGGET